MDTLKFISIVVLALLAAAMQADEANGSDRVLDLHGLRTRTEVRTEAVRGAQRSGRILNISSIGGNRSGPGFGVYCSTKFAVEGLSEALHDELAPLGIHVTVIEPGYFRTDFLDATSLSKSEVVIADYRETAGAVREKVIDLNHQQPGDPEKLAQVIVAFGAAENPPVRLPLGSDTVAAITAKHASDAEILARWHATAVSTDFPSNAR